MNGPTVITDTKTGKSKTEREADVRNSYPLPFQQKWVDDKSRNKLAEKSRQVGWTFTEALNRTLRASKEKAPYDAWVTSRDREQAKLFIEDCKHWARVLNIAATDLGEVVFENDKDLKSYDLRLASGKVIHSMSSNPDAQAGKRGDRTADEFALHKDQRKLYGIMKPGLQWGGQLSIFSTHRGNQSFFNQLIREAREGGNPKRFSLHRVTIVDAVEQGLWLKIKSQLSPREEDPNFDERAEWTDDQFLQSCRDECPDEELFEEEYMCNPSDDGQAVLTWEDIIACSSPTLPLAGPAGSAGAKYLGVDVGRRRDLTVFWLLEDIGGGFLVTAGLKVLKKERFRKQRELLYSWLSDPTIKKCCIDENGIGMQLAEEAEEDFGQERVEAVPLTMQSKQQMGFALQTKFQDRKVTIPFDRIIHADLHSVKKETTAAANLVLRAEAGSSDGHADRFWGLALANRAAETLINPGIFARLRSMINRGRDERRTRRTGGAL